MKTRKTSLLLASTSAAALSIFAFGSMGSTSAYAECTGTSGGTDGAGYIGNGSDNVVSCNTLAPNGAGSVQGRGGDDTIMSTGTVRSSFSGGSGNDTITINDGGTSFGGNVWGDLNKGSDQGPPGEDTIIITNDASVFQVFGDNGSPNDTDGQDDLIEIDASTVRGSIFGEAGDDTINVLTDGSVGNDVEGNAGNDTITIAGYVDEDVFGDRRTPGDNGDDLIILNAGANVINVYGDSDIDPVADDGDDTIIMNGGQVFGFITGEGGDDTITIAGGVVEDDFGGFAGNVFGSAGDDTINITSGTIENTVFGGSGEDQINMSDGVVENDVEGGSGNDQINISGGVVFDDIQGDSGNDTIIVNGTAFIGEDVEGDSGNDTIEIGGTAEVVRNVEGNSGNDLITVSGGEIGGDVIGDETDLPDGEDTITITDGSIGGSVFGDSGTEFDFDDRDDTISMSSGTVGGSIFGEGGDDEITLDGGLVSGSIFGDGLQNEIGNDFIVMNSGTVGGNVEGNAGDDAIFINGGLVGNDVFGDRNNATLEPIDDGDDYIVIRGGVISGTVYGDSGGLDGTDDGNDAIRITGGLVVGDVNAENGDNLVILGSIFGPPGNGTVQGNILTGDGEDIIVLDEGTVGIDVRSGKGEDIIVLVDADIGDDIFSGGNDDVILLFGGTVGGDVSGDGGDDFMVQAGANIGTVVNGEFRGRDGNDILVLFDGTIGDFAAGDAGDDIGVVAGPFNFDNLGAGTGNFAGDENSGPPSDDGDDTLFFFDWAGEVNADRLPEWNTVNIIEESAVTLTGGTLQTDSGLLGSAIEVFIEEDSALLLNNNGLGGDDVIIDGNLTNEGLIDLSSNDTDPDNVLTVTGDYTAASDLVIDTFLDDGKSVPDNTDLLSIGGNAGGMTRLTVEDVDGSPGGLTGDGPTDGILVVEAATSDVDAFSLTNADLFAGIFEYELVNPEGQPVGQSNWYLQSDFLDQIYVYEALPTAMQTIGSALIGQLVERVGVRSGVASALTDADGNPVLGGQPVDTALWARAVGASVESEGDLDSTTGGNFEQTLGFIQAGGEVVVTQGTSGRLLIGALGHWGTSSVDVFDSDNDERGGADFDFYGGGLTATWYGTSGLYVDGVVQYTAYDIDISTTSRWSSQSTDGYGIAASGEVGYRIPISATAALVPQAQVVWQTIDFDDFTDPDGVTVSLNDGDSLVGRLGVAFENSAAIGSSLVTGYVEANLLHEFLGDNEINTFTGVGGNIPISQDVGGTSVEVGFGATVAVNSGVSLYGEIDYTIPFDNGVQGFQALAGVRVNLNPVAPPPPAPVIAPVAETAFIVFFDWDRANLTPEANLVLDDVVVTANEAGYASIRLDGYTDLSGSAAYNLGLSERRANSVADGLIARGIAPDEIVIRAFGEENPLVPTPDGVREPQNRRVEIFLS